MTMAFCDCGHDATDYRYTRSGDRACNHPGCGCEDHYPSAFTTPPQTTTTKEAPTNDTDTTPEPERPRSGRRPFKWPPRIPRD